MHARVVHNSRLSLILLSIIALVAGMVTMVVGASSARAASSDTNASVDGVTIKVTKKWDGTGHGTPDQTFINSKNSYVPGDNTPTDGYVATSDKVGYEFAMNFSPGPARDVRVNLTGAPYLTPDGVSSICTNGVNYTATMQGDTCVFSLQEEANGSMTRQFTATANGGFDGGVSDNQAVSASTNAGMFSADPVRVLQATRQDAVLSNRSSDAAPSGYINALTGVGTMYVRDYTAAIPGYNSNKGRATVGAKTNVDISDFPEGTTWKTSDPNAVIDTTAKKITDITIGSTVTFTIPQQFRPASAADITNGGASRAYVSHLYFTNPPYGLTGSPNLLVGDEPGDNEDRNYRTGDKARGITAGDVFPNNDWISMEWLFNVSPPGDIAHEKNVYAPEFDFSPFTPGSKSPVNPQGKMRNIDTVHANSSSAYDQGVSTDTELISRPSLNFSDLDTKGEPPVDTAALCDLWSPSETPFDPARVSSLKVMHSTPQGVKTDMTANTTFYYTTAPHTSTAGDGTVTGNCKDVTSDSSWSTTRPADLSTITGITSVTTLPSTVSHNTGLITLDIPQKTLSSYSVADGKQFFDYHRGAVNTTNMDIITYVNSIIYRIPVAPAPLVSKSAHVVGENDASPGSTIRYSLYPSARLLTQPTDKITPVITDTLDRCTLDPTPTDDTLLFYDVTYVNKGLSKCGDPSSPQTQMIYRLKSGSSVMPLHNIEYTTRVAAVIPVSKAAYTIVNTVSEHLAEQNVSIQDATASSRLTVSQRTDTASRKLVDSPRVEVGDKIGWRLQTYNQTGISSGTAKFVDILPYNGDYSLRGSGFFTYLSGPLNVTDIHVESGDSAPGTTLEFTNANQSTIDMDNPDKTGITWTSNVNSIGGFSKVTAVRVTIPNFGAEGSSAVSVKVDATPVNDIAGNFASNNFGIVKTGQTLSIPRPAPVRTTIVASAINGRVWWDEDDNTVNDPSEPGMSGKTVTLTRIDDGTNRTWTTTTNNKGDYSFTNLHSGRYTVSITRGDGTTQVQNTMVTKYGKTVPVEQTYSWKNQRFTNSTTTAAPVLGIDSIINNVDFGFFYAHPDVKTDKKVLSTVDAGNGFANITYQVDTQNAGNITETNAHITDVMNGGQQVVSRTGEIINSGGITDLGGSRDTGASRIVIDANGGVWTSSATANNTPGDRVTLTPYAWSLPPERVVSSVTAGLDDSPGRSVVYFLTASGKVWFSPEYSRLGGGIGTPPNTGYITTNSPITSLSLSAGSKRIVLMRGADGSLRETYAILSPFGGPDSGSNVLSLPGGRTISRMITDEGTKTSIVQATDGTLWSFGTHYSSIQYNDQQSVGDIKAIQIIPDSSITSHGDIKNFSHGALIMSDGSVLHVPAIHDYADQEDNQGDFTIPDSIAWSSTGQYQIPDGVKAVTAFSTPVSFTGGNALYFTDQNGDLYYSVLAGDTVINPGEGQSTVSGPATGKIPLPEGRRVVQMSEQNTYRMVRLDDGSVVDWIYNTSSSTGSTPVAGVTLGDKFRARGGSVPSVISPTTTSSVAGVTTDVYDVDTLLPGDIYRMIITTRVPYKTVDQFLTDQAFSRTDNTPADEQNPSPAIPYTSVTQQNASPDAITGNSSCVTGPDLPSDSDRCDQVPAYVPRQVNPLISLVTIGDRVWLDANHNGIQDPEETTGIAGVPVDVWNSDDTAVVAHTTTDAQGHWSVSIPSGMSYTVRYNPDAITDPQGEHYAVSPSGVGGDRAVDSDGVKVSTGILTSDDTTIDLGLFPAVRQVKINKSTTTPREDIAQGKSITYSVTVLNSGNTPLTGVTMNDLPISGLSDVSLSAPSTGTVSGLVWTIPTLDAGRSAQVTVTGTVSGAQVVNDATVSADLLPVPTGPVQVNQDVDSDTDQKDEESVTLSPKVQVAKRADSDISAKVVGDSVGYDITVHNNGDADAVNTVMTDDAISGLSDVVLSSPSVGTITGNRWSVGTLTPGTTATVHVTGVLTGGVSLNRSSVSADGLPTPTTTPIQRNNTDVTADTDQRDEVDGTPRPAAHRLQVSKNTATTSVISGDVITYTVTVRNGGNVTEHDVVVDDSTTGLSGAVFSAPSTGAVSGTRWSVGDLAPGATGTATVTATVAGNSAVTNTVGVSSRDVPPVNDGSPIQPNNTDVTTDTDQRDVVNTPLRAPKVQVAKNAVSDISNTVVGELAEYDITVRNGGDADAVNTVMTDDAISGLDQITLSHPSVGTITGNRWSVGTLTPGTTATVHVTGVLTGGVSLNRASVSADGLPTPTGTPVQRNNTDVTADIDQRDEVMVRPTPVSHGLQVAKKAQSAPADLGHDYTYTVTVRNSGNVTEHEVVVDDTAVSGLSGVVFSDPSTGTASGARWSVGDLVPGKTVTATVTGRVIPATGGSVINTVGVSSHDVPPVTPTTIQPNNTDVTADTDQHDQTTTTMRTPDLQVAKSLVGGTRKVGDTATFTVTAHNNGPVDATGVVVDDTAVSGLDNVTFVNPSAGTVSGSKWSIGTLTSGQTVTATVTAKVTGPAVNDAVVTGDDLPAPNTTPVQRNNSDVTEDTDQRDEVDVPVSPNLQVAKNATSTPKRVGDTITYTVTAKNASAFPAQDVVVDDTAVSGLDRISLSDPSVGTVSGTRWTIGDMAPGATATVTVTGRVTAGVVDNTVSISDPLAPAPTGTPIQRNNTDVTADTDQRDESTTTLPPILKVAKSLRSGQTPMRGKTITYDVVALNDGPTEARDVVVTDLGGAGIVPSSITVNGVSTGVVSGTRWSIPSLAPGQRVTATVTATVSNTAIGDIINDVTVANPDLPVPTGTPIQTNNGDPTADTDQRDETSTPVVIHTLQVAKKALDAPILGHDHSYTVTVRNSGSVVEHNVVVDDHVIAGLDNATFSAPSTGTVTGSTWSVGDLAPGQQVTATVIAHVVRTNGDTVSNSVGVSSQDVPPVTDGSPIQPNNTDVTTDTDQRDITTGTLLAPVIKVSKKTSSDIAHTVVGGTASYDITVLNDGRADATGVVMTDDAISGLSDVVLSDPSAGTITGSVWTIGTLAPGNKETVHVTGTLTGGEAVNRATVTGQDLPAPTGTPVQRNNDDPSADTDQRDQTSDNPVPARHALQVSKKAQTDSVSTGDTLTYTVTVRNSGNIRTHDVVVNDDAFAGLTKVTLSAPSTGSVNGNTWNVGDLAPGETATMTVTGTVTGDSDPINRVGVSSREVPPVTGGDIQKNNDDVTADTDQRDETSTHLRVPKVQIAKKITVDPSTLHRGDHAPYLITVHNAGDAPATKVVVTDVAGNGVSDIHLSDPQRGDVSGATWTIGTMDAGETLTVKVIATVTEDTAINGVRVDADRLPATNEGVVQRNNDDVTTDTDQRDEVEVTLGRPMTTTTPPTTTPTSTLPSTTTPTSTPSITPSGSSTPVKSTTPVSPPHPTMDRPTPSAPVKVPPQSVSTPNPAPVKTTPSLPTGPAVDTGGHVEKSWWKSVLDALL